MQKLTPLPVRILQAVGKSVDYKKLEGSIAVMSFNILAQCYTRSEFFPNVNPKAALKWKNRGPLIIKEIVQYSPDIVCLQECDSWDDFMLPGLDSHGYTGVFKQKTDGKQDGVAILWKKEMFLLKESDPIEYGIRNGVGLVVSLTLAPISGANDGPSDKASEQTVVVANTHLFWNPEVEYIKLRQAQIFLQRAAQVGPPFATSSLHKPSLHQPSRIASRLVLGNDSRRRWRPGGR